MFINLILTFCSKSYLKITGYDLDVVNAALFKLFFDYIKMNEGLSVPWSPIEAAILNNKQFLDVSFNLFNI